MTRSRVRAGLAAFVFLAGASAASAYQLHPSVAQPLSQLMNAAAQMCQMGNPQACGFQQQLAVMGNQLMYTQSMCEQGDQNACYQLNMAAMQLNGEVQAMVMQQQANAAAAAGTGGGMGMGMTHQERMAMQQQAFQNHQNTVQQRSDMMDRNHASFMEYLRQ